MDLTTKWFIVNDVQAMDPTMATSAAGRPCGLYAARNSSGNLFLDAFPEPNPLCKLNLKETSEFVGSLATAARTSVDGGNGLLDISTNRRRDGANSAMQLRRAEPQAPCTPGRPIFGFSSVAGSIGSHNNSSGGANHLLPQRRSFPSKWDDADKWVMGPGGGGSSHGSPAHPLVRTTSNSSILRKQALLFAEDMTFAERSRVINEEVMVSKSKVVPYSNGVSAITATAAAAEVVLKDKFTDEVWTILPKFRCHSEPSSKEGFLFGERIMESMKDKATDAIHCRDIGTEMTPLGSSTNSRCHTPFKSSSPARHNTPASRSGPLSLENCQDGSGNIRIPAIDIGQLNEYHHLAKIKLGGGGKNYYDSVTSNRSSREEEEEEVSKSLRHFEKTNGASRCLQKSSSQSRAAAAAAASEKEEQLKCCLRYQREEAKIQSWANLESAKAEAQSRKLEVKIQKMRSRLEEKLMMRMAAVHRKAEEWRAEARQQHSDQIDKTTVQAKKMERHYGSCGCFP